MAVALQPRALGSGRLTRSGRTRLVKLSSVERSFEESRHVLYPSQKKLSTVESQRIMTVAKETKKRIEGILIIPQLPDHLERFAVAMGTELVAMLQECHTLAQKYMECYEHLLESDIQPDLLIKRSTNSLSHTPRLPPITETLQTVQYEFNTIQHQLRHLTKSILRELIQCPSFDVLSKEMLASSPAHHVHILNLLSDVVKLMEETLLTTHEEEVKRYEYLTATNDRYSESEIVIANLQTELQSARDERNREVRVSCHGYMLYCLIR